MRTKNYPTVGQPGEIKTYLNAFNKLYTNPDKNASAFKDAIHATGIGIDSLIIGDGQLHRFTVSGDKPKSLTGWYVLHNGDISAGAFGCWKRGINQKWCSKSRNHMTARERRDYRELTQKAARQRKQELQKRYDEARQNAYAIWSNSKAVVCHPYLTQKHCQSFGLRLSGDALVMPLRDISGVLHSLQFIKPDGTKRMLPGGRKKGTFHLIGAPKNILLICEGYSTGATLHKCTGYPVAIAIDAGNLKPAGRSFRKACPGIKLVFCADNDQYNKVNVGVKKATEAAKVVDGFIAVPEFVDTSSKPTDFNDLYLLEGGQAIQGVKL